MKYENLFSPLKLNSIMLKNRIMAAPMGVVSADAMISSTYYGGLSLLDKSLGGVGVIYVDADNDSPVDGIFSKYERERTREIIYVIKQAGAKAGAEVTVYGKRLANGRFNGPVSGIRFDGAKMKEMTKKDMTVFMHRVGKQCREVKEFGFDTILLCFGADSLCSQFLSPAFNTRDDEYGGSLENRIRFPKEALSVIRDYVGPDYPLQLQIDRDLMVPEAYDPEDVLYFAESVKDKVDMINICTGMDTYGGTYNNYIGNIHAVTTAHFPHMYGIEFATRVKEACQIPVSLVGGVLDPKEADDAIREGKLDAVLVGRQLVADPYWPNKAQNGQDDDIIPCIRCGNCFHFTTEHKNVVCSVNPRFRRENRVPVNLEKADKSMKVVVVGGGPAGCKAAVTASERGHQVILLEMSSKLGGLINTSDYSSLKKDLRRYRDYIIHQVEKHDIEVRTNVEADRAYVEGLNPDAIIIAVGADPVMPNIKGIESKNVLPVMDVYNKNMKLDGNVVIIGGGTVGCELAIEVADDVDQVTIVEVADKLAGNANSSNRLSLDYFMNKHSNINVMVRNKCVEITDQKVHLEGRLSGKTELEADHVVIAVGFKPKRALVESLYGITPDTFEAGDCERVGSVCEATNYGYFVAANLG
jgi:2,4-dienoyl-CoA reductase-like NADH-dependent reductase (Old Yellow Enzyme family)/thioredoxin reductase